MRCIESRADGRLREPIDRAARGAVLVAGSILLVLGGSCGGPGDQREPVTDAARADGSRKLPTARVVKPPPSSVKPAVQDAPLPTTVAELFKEAEREMSRLVESFPHDPEAFETKARFLFCVGRNVEAGECWERALDLNPQFAYAYHGLGRKAARDGDYEQAVALQQKALSLAPGLSDVLLELADLLVKLGRSQEAVALLEIWLENNPDSPETRLTLAQACLASQEYEKAREAFELFLEQDPDNALGQFGLATALARLGNTEEARLAMARHSELRSRDREEVSDLRGNVDDYQVRATDLAARYAIASRVYAAHGRLDETERLCRRAAQLDPRHLGCRLGIAEICQRTGRYREAVAMYQELMRLAPDNAAFPINLGMLQANLGDTQSARAAFRKSIQLAPDSPHGYAALARLLFRHPEDRDEAVQAIRKAVELNPSNEANRELLKRLE